MRKYISIIDNAIRYREEERSKNSDKRKISRGLSLNSIKITNVREIVKKIDANISVYSLKKSQLISIIETYIKDNNLYCYI